MTPAAVSSPSTRPAPAWAAPALIVAIGVIAVIVYLAAGRRDIGTAAFDVAFSPAMPASAQLDMSARDVPSGSMSVSAVIARASSAIARGRRTALRDLAAVTSASALVAFGFILRAAGLPPFSIALTLLAMMMGQTFWWRGVYWSGNALTPALGTIVGLREEFTMLGLCLATVGGIALVAGTRARLVPIIAVIAATILYVTQLTDLPLVLCGWTAIAVALAWLLQTLPSRSGRAIVTVAAVVLIASPALSRIRLSALGSDLDSSIAARTASELRAADLPGNAVVIAESRRADAIVRQSNIPLVAQSTEAIDATLTEGRVPIAFPGAEAHLGTMGFLFERAWAGNVPIAVVAGRAACVNLVDGEWVDVSLLTATGSFVLHGPAYGSAPGGAVIRVAGARSARVAAIDPRSVPYEITGDAGATTIRVPRTGREDAVIVTLEESPATASATADEGNPVTLCPGRVRTPLLLDRRGNASAQIDMNHNHVFVSGWHPVEADPDYFRWTSSPEAIVRVPIAPPGPVRVTITATPAVRRAQKATIALAINQCRLESRAMQPDQADYEWIAGRECWQSGSNSLVIGMTPLMSPASVSATHDTRLLGARIGAIRLARVPDQNAK